MDKHLIVLMFGVALIVSSVLMLVNKPFIDFFSRVSTHPQKFEEGRKFTSISGLVMGGFLVALSLGLFG